MHKLSKIDLFFIVNSNYLTTHHCTNGIANTDRYECRPAREDRTSHRIDPSAWQQSSSACSGSVSGQCGEMVEHANIRR